MLFTSDNLRSKQPILAFGLHSLRLIGLWGDRSRLYRYALSVLSIVIILLPKATLGSGRAEYDSFARNVAEFVFLAENCLSIGIFASRRKSFERLIDVLERIFQREWSEPLRDEINRLNRRLDFVARLYALYVLISVILFLAVPVLLSVFKVIMYNADERSDFTLIMEVQFYGLDIRRNFCHYLIYTIFCCFASVSSAYESSIKGTVFLIILQYGSQLFELVSKRISNLKQISEGVERNRELRKIIELHNFALDYLRHLEATVSFVLINQTLNCIFIWCLMLFYVSTNFGPEAMNVILLFVVLLVEMAVCCINGTMISEKAAQVGHAMYQHPWYNDCVELQQTSRFIIQRAQKPTGLTAAKFYFVNIQRLGSMFHATYSYYLILKKRF
ncbi:odorant receptor 49b-like [Wyeomyia smithii]|uniref:odorant receptor 49b-like n=1 Tax=Wyeomyia smithii TaxID=174621 RepID=UPI002467E40C|nr:odorant receptor 49b-like [Wyeomyia smithii]